MKLAAKAGRGSVDQDSVRTHLPTVAAATTVTTPVELSEPGGSATQFGQVLPLPGLAVGPADNDHELVGQGYIDQWDGARGPLNGVRRARGAAVGNPSFVAGPSRSTTNRGVNQLRHDLTPVVQQVGPQGNAQRYGTIRRMKIIGLGKNPQNDVYKKGDTIKFRTDFARVKNITKEQFDAQLKTDTGISRPEDFNLLFNFLAAANADYPDLKDFLKELAILRTTWGGQKFFYEKPDGKNKLVEQAAVEGQVGQDIRLYSARGLADIQKLKVWADRAPMVPTTGFGGIVTVGIDDKQAPFKGHFADRAHTVNMPDRRVLKVAAYCVSC